MDFSLSNALGFQPDEIMDGGYVPVVAAPAGQMDPLEATRKSDFNNTSVEDAINIALGSNAISESIAQIFGVQSGGYNPNASPSSGAERDRSNDQAPAQEENLVSRLLGGAKDGFDRAYKKDPLAILKLGAGALGNVYTADEKRKAQARQEQAALDQQNNSAALKKAEIDRYNQSFSTGARKPAPTFGPLARMGGQRVFTDGVIKG